MPRIHGLETEYGLLARTVSASGRGRLGPAEAAQLLFAPVEQENASSNVFLRNGGRLYLDVGSHPEYATPECLTPDELIVRERAGDDIVAALAVRAVEAAAERGRQIEFRLFKNNVDSHRNSYGSHENFSLDRELDLDRAAQRLTPFLVTRQLLCGAGRWTPDGFLVSQRAEHLHEGLSAMTTRSRPLINTRDEPLADPSRFRRLHVLAGDSNLSEPSALLKVGSLSLALDALEADALPAFELAEPATAIRDVARNPRARVTLTDGSRPTALDVQRAYLEATGSSSALADRWAEVLERLEAGALDSLEADVEWVAKLRLLERFAARHNLAWSDRRLAQVDLAFHDLTADASGRPRGLFRLLEADGAVTRLSDPAEVAAARATPPPNTRAAVRGRLIDVAQRQGRRYTVDWVGFTVHDLPVDGRREEIALQLPDPFASSSAASEALTDTLTAGWRPRG